MKFLIIVLLIKIIYYIILMNVINIILLVLIIIIILGFNNNYNKIINYFNNNKNNNLSDKDTQIIYLFLSDKYGDILLPKNITFTNNNNIYYFKFNIVKNDNNININMKFIPSSIYITKYSILNQHGHFELINNIEIDKSPIIEKNIDLVDTENNSTEYMINNLDL